MAGLIDTIYTFRFLKILSTKWTDMDAFKLGIVDEDGKALKMSGDLKLNTEKSAYTPFHRLIFKLKRLMEKIPGGKSFVGRYGAALLLIKEHQTEVEGMGVDFKTLQEGLKRYIEDKPRLNEEGEGGAAAVGPTNSVKGIAGKDTLLGKAKKRKKKVDEEEDIEEEYIPSYSYQLIGNVLIRVDEKNVGRKRVRKKRVIAGKRQKTREYKSGKNSKYTRTGNRKLRGGALARKRKSLRKANRKAKTGSAKAKRRRNTKKSNKYN